MINKAKSAFQKYKLRLTKEAIQKYYIQAVGWVLLTVFKVKMEYLLPQSWKAVDPYDMLCIVTKNPNVLVLKSSEANDPKMKIYAKGAEDHEYTDNSGLTFLFDGRISRTKNDNLSSYQGGDTPYVFKYDLITVHGKFMTYFIIAVMRYYTKQLLKLAKSKGMLPTVKPVNTEFYGMDENAVIEKMKNSGMLGSAYMNDPKNGGIW